MKNVQLIRNKEKKWFWKLVIMDQARKQQLQAPEHLSNQNFGFTTAENVIYERVNEMHTANGLDRNARECTPEKEERKTNEK